MVLVPPPPLFLHFPLFMPTLPPCPIVSPCICIWTSTQQGEACKNRVLLVLRRCPLLAPADSCPFSSDFPESIFFMSYFSILAKLNHSLLISLWLIVRSLFHISAPISLMHALVKFNTTYIMPSEPTEPEFAFINKIGPSLNAPHQSCSFYQ